MGRIHREGARSIIRYLIHLIDEGSLLDVMHRSWARWVGGITLRAGSRGASSSRRSGADTRSVVTLTRATVNLIVAGFFAVVADCIPGGRWAVGKAGGSTVVVGRAVGGGGGTLISTLLELATFGVEGINLGV